MAIFSKHTTYTLALITTLVTAGTLYSYSAGTFLDTSNALLAHLPHPSHGRSIFASKGTWMNKYFVKYAWGWTTLAFWAVWATAGNPSVMGYDYVGKWVGATLVWMGFASWFFGPSLSARLLSYSGAECAIIIPPSSPDATATLLAVPQTYCVYRQTVTPGTHPDLFVLPESHQLVRGIGPLSTDFKAIPKLYRGHDVSGHTFLLSLSILFLVDALMKARRAQSTAASLGAQAAAWSLVALWLTMLYATAVYFHTWEEKASGLGTFIRLLRLWIVLRIS